MSNGRPFRRTIRRLVLASEVREDDPPAVRERAARRRIVATTGVCPCGARAQMPDELEPGTVTFVAVEHEIGCPAIDEAI